MIKKSIIALLLFAVCGFASAQSLRFECNGTIYAEGETVICDSLSFGEYVQMFRVRNLTDAPLNVKLTKETVQDIQGVSHFFCWGSCYMPETITTPRPVEIPAGSLSDEMTLHALFDEGIYGDVIVKYSVFDEAAPEQRTSIIVKFHKTGTGIEEPMQCNLGHAYPNPASSMVYFDYEIPLTGSATLSVYNLVGQEVMSHQLHQVEGRMSLPVDNLNEGIYFCNLTVNGQVVKTEKFIVKK